MQKGFMTVLVAVGVAALPLLPGAAVSAQGTPKSNQFWWPEQLDLAPLRQHAVESNPLGEDFDYAKAFQPRSQCREAGHHDGPDHIPGLVAGRLRQLRAVLRPDGLAWRRYLPHG